MPRKQPYEIFRYYLRWLSLSALIGASAGVASAFFLRSLELATDYRLAHPVLLYLLPVGGLLVGLLYHYYGRSVEAGSNLILDEFHEPSAVIPLRMAPLVLVGTVLTHLFGGSAGREGTAVQMGASLADQFTHVFKIAPANRRILLMAGMSAGFGSVFGVPFAGMIFGMEVLAVGRLHLWAILQCAVAAFVAHYTTLALGITHTLYPAPEVPALHWLTALSVIAAGVAFGAAARLFGFSIAAVNKQAKARVPYLPLRAALGGGVLSLLYLAWPELTRYSGLGVPIIVESLHVPVPLYDWFGKLGMTVMTLGLGFKGGEVTPLLFVGSTLGNALALVLPVPLGLLSSLGLVGVFAGAANTPVACTVMAMELFGTPIFPYAALACFASYAASGHHGIYHAQRVHTDKRLYISRTFKLLGGLFAVPPVGDK